MLVIVTLAASAARADDGKAAAGAVVETGELGGAAYRIDVPKAWNHKLVVYYHGYAVTPVRLPAGEPLAPQLQQFVDRGFAVAQSAYSQTGWAVEQAYVDSERLRVRFGASHGQPEQTYVVGMSMGGALTLLALESAPDTYAGGLSLCGALEQSDDLLQADFALRAAFDYYFPDLLGPLVPVPPEFQPTPAIERKIADAFKAKPKAAAALLRLWGVGDLNTLAAVISSNTFEIGELQRRTKGNPFANADLVYTGSGDDFALNSGVKRYRADPKPIAYVVRWYTPNGRLKRPLLALHDVADPLVPASSAFGYAALARRTGNADRFVQQFVNKAGHCVFTPEEIGRAFDQLVGWVQNGERPTAGELPKELHKN
jgi:pimeloyl-ACP methyl ester carboxylesterase